MDSCPSSSRRPIPQNLLKNKNLADYLTMNYRTIVSDYFCMKYGAVDVFSVTLFEIEMQEVGWAAAAALGILATNSDNCIGPIRIT